MSTEEYVLLMSDQVPTQEERAVRRMGGFPVRPAEKRDGRKRRRRSSGRKVEKAVKLMSPIAEGFE